jgi:hypothetical protein
MITRMLPFCAAVAVLWAAVLVNPAEAQVPPVPTNESIMKPVKGSQYIGLEHTEEGAYHHLKFFEEKGTFLVEGDFTWDLWVQSGQEPLVHRVVIVPSQKRLTYTEPPIIFETLEKITKTFSNWKLNPNLPPETFVIPPLPKDERSDLTADGGRRPIQMTP